MKKNEYRLKAEYITRKYSEFIEDFAKLTDDRRVAYNCYRQIMNACEAMEGQEDTFIRNAVNNHIQEEMKTIDRIITRFTRKVYQGMKWLTPEEISALHATEEPKVVSYREFWIALCELREKFRPHNISIEDYTNSETGNVVLYVSWSSIGATQPDKARDFADWVRIASDAAEHFKYAGYRVEYGN